MLDGAIIEDPRSTKNKAGERDKEMHQTKIGNQWYFSIKAHIGVDAMTGLTHSFTTSVASEQLSLKTEYFKASIRTKAEHPFRMIKCQFSFVKTRYSGQMKNDSKLAMLFALANIMRVDKILRA